MKVDCIQTSPPCHCIAESHKVAGTGSIVLRPIKAESPATHISAGGVFGFDILTAVKDENQASQSILHICGRETILELRDQIFRLNGYEVTSTLDMKNALNLFRQRPYTIVLIDVEGEGRVASAEHLCGEIKQENPDQMVAFLCNSRVAVTSDCPDEIIQAEFNPAAMIKGVNQLFVPVEN